MGGIKCAAIGCNNYMKKTTEIKYHRFPIDRYVDWLKLCGRHDLVNKNFEYVNKNLRICSAHFDQNMYSNPELTRLLSSATPAIFDKNSELNVSENVSSDVVFNLNTTEEPTFDLEDLQVDPLSMPTTSENSRSW